MLFSFSSLLLLSATVASVFAAPPVPDSDGLYGPISIKAIDDPFYTPKPGFNLIAAARGQIIRVRQIRPNASEPRIESTWQLLFRSESQNGTALAAVTTIFVPVGAQKDRVVLTARYTNSISRSCARSTAYANGTIDDGNFFDQKWIVSSADFEGPNGANSAGRLQGRILLDAGRATQNFASVIGLAANTKYVLHGYSGGSVAAAWGAQLFKTYGQGLNVAGAVMGGLPGNPRQVIEAVDGGLFAGLGLLGAFGLGNAYSTISATLDRQLTPAGAALRASSLQKCGADAYQSLVGKRLLSTDTNKLGNKLLDDPTIKPVLDSLIIGGNPAEVPEIPVFIFHGAIDQIVPERTLAPSVKAFCATGKANLVYNKVWLAEHFGGFGNANIVPFIRDRFDGKVWLPGCRYMNTVVSSQTIDFNSKGAWRPQQQTVSQSVKDQSRAKAIKEQKALTSALRGGPAARKAAIRHRIAILKNAQN